MNLPLDPLGLLQQAAGGTLYLKKEVGEVPLRVQMRLAHYLESRDEGAPATATPARLVAGTHFELRTLVDKGDFRSDLFSRLNVHSALVPPLRDRAGAALS